MAHVIVKYNGEVMRNMVMTFEAARALSLQLAFKQDAEVIIEAV